MADTRAGGPGELPGSGPEHAESIRVVVDGQVDLTNAPVPRTRAERVVFTQLYGTLVTVDCAGQVVPALAASWQVSADGREWFFTLAPGAEYSDGTPVSAESIARDWLERRALALTTANRPRTFGRTPGTEFRLSAIEQVAAVDEHVLRVRTAYPLPLQAFAVAEFAVTRRTPNQAWPLGTNGYAVSEGPLRLIAIDAAATGSGQLEPGDRRGGPREIIIVPSGDPRDAADDPATDVLITGDARAVDYLTRLSDFTSKPLAWDRRYVFAWVPDGVPAVGAVAEDSVPGPASRSDSMLARMIGGLPVDVLRTQLANDVVRGESRAALPAGGVPCQAEARMTAAPPPDTVYYDATDRVARGIAERIVALARGARTTAAMPVAAAVRAEVLDGMLATGHGQRVAIVVGLPLSSCAPGAPLVDVRPLVSVRAAVRNVLVDGNGRVWLGAVAGAQPPGGRE